MQHEATSSLPRHPATIEAIQLDHACILTTDLQGALAFYVDVLGLGLRVVEEDPLRPGHQRALLVDGREDVVLEIIEMKELSNPTIPGRGGLHHLGFRLPGRAWRSLRGRLDAVAYEYQQIDGRLFVRDADGLVLEIEQAPYE